MSKPDIVWAETAWHCWRMPRTSFQAEEARDHHPDAAYDYQPNFRRGVMYSVLNDTGVSDLTIAVERGEKIMRWRLQHFSNRHASQLEWLLANHALTEPDPSSMSLAMIAHRQWMEMDNSLVAEALVKHLMDLQYTAAEVMSELMLENGMLGRDRDGEFAAFVDHCEAAWRNERLSRLLTPKTVDEKKVKI